MDFKDLQGRKLQEEQEAAAAARSQAESAASSHGRLVNELEPKLNSLVHEVFAALQSAGVPPANVTVDGVSTGVKAYGLGRVNFNRRGRDPWADVAIDSEGRMALRQGVTADTEQPYTIRACASLDPGYRDLLEKASRSDAPRGTSCVHLSTSGDLMFTEQYVASDDYHYRTSPLAGYLAGLAAKAVTESAG